MRVSLHACVRACAEQAGWKTFYGQFPTEKIRNDRRNARTVVWK